MSAIPQLETIRIILSATGVAQIEFNRPERYNALSRLVYKEWLTAIRWAASSEEVKVTVMTGNGKYFSSGQELSASEARQGGEVFSAEWLNVMGLGPAIGFGATSIALCDAIYSVPHATFTTPFMKLGFCAEGCSTVTFPRSMGMARANEMLLFGRTCTAKELEECGFISRILPAEGFRESVLKIAEESTKFSIEAIKVTKDLVHSRDRPLLLEVNAIEMQKLKERMSSEDCLQSVLRFTGK
ncbi:ClpP/crotonase-like domain-containing protein [Spinellus fusiger]|nr:ClpP/crotonase-like domain-containing protein [Spinellus fusiger]